MSDLYASAIAWTYTCLVAALSMLAAPANTQPTKHFLKCLFSNSLDSPLDLFSRRCHLSPSWLIAHLEGSISSVPVDGGSNERSCSVDVSSRR